MLYAGELVEEGPTEEILHNPRHPYTVGLLRCIPRGGLGKSGGKLDTIRGFLPAIGEHLPGCVYVHRCALAQEICAVEKPADAAVGPAHQSRCHFHELRAAASARHERSPRRRPWRRPHGDTAPQGRRPHEDVQAGRPRDQGARRSVRRALAGRDARARRRVGQRQDDLRPHAARHRRADVRHRRDRRPRDAAEPRVALLRRRGGPADRLPEPRLRAEPPAHRAADAQAHARRSSPTSSGRGGREALGGARRGGAAARARAVVAADRALGRAEAARGDRARVRGRAPARRVRRADVRARRLGAGGDPQPARRPAGIAAERATSSSATTSASCATSPTGSRFSTSAG